MADDGRAPEATELLYMPAPSLAPLGIAAGAMLLITGLYAGPFYIGVGAVLALGGLVRWLRAAREEIARLPRGPRA